MKSGFQKSLTCSIPQGELNVLSINFNICDIVLKDSRDVELLKEEKRVSWVYDEIFLPIADRVFSSSCYLRECSFGKNDQETGFATSTIAYNDKLSSDFSHTLGTKVRISGRDKVEEEEKFKR